VSAAPVRAVPVATLRKAIARAVEASSTRAVADAVGISHSGIRKFVAGSDPHAGTVRKLSAWYVRHAAGTGPVDATTAGAAIALLVSGLPEGEAEAVQAGLLDLLRDAYLRSGAEPPDWLPGSRG
jgi:hypothetical protein